MNLEIYQLLHQLSDGHFHSGENIAKVFKTSRTSISKRVARLNQYLSEYTSDSLKVETVIGKGYCLNTKFDALCVQEIRKNIAEKISSNLAISFIPILDSTNNYLRDTQLDLNKFTLCIAEHQFLGRGRNMLSRQKSWYSPFGSNIYCSIAWHYPGNSNALIGLSLVAGIVVAELLHDCGINDVKLKWPNDILVNNKKIAGILIESFGDTCGSCKLVIGVGLNINNNYNELQKEKLSLSITQPWTNLFAELSKVSLTMPTLSRNTIIAQLVDKFIAYYQRFSTQGIEDILKQWDSYDYLINKMININIAGNIVLGKYIGINTQGALIAEVDGKTRTYYSGEVSLTPLSYVNQV